MENSKKNLTKLFPYAILQRNKETKEEKHMLLTVLRKRNSQRFQSNRRSFSVQK